MDVRRVLSDMLDGFEEALDLGDAEAIERHREALQQFLDQHDPSSEEAGDGLW